VAFVVPEPASIGFLVAELGGMFLWNWLVYWLILGAWQAYRYYDHYIASELRLERLEKSFSEARLNALRMQLDPHFLFNALNTIGYLIRTSPARAQETLMKLTTLLRRVLRSGDTLTTLRDEIDLVTTYLQIETERFEERLRISIDVPAALRGIRILPFVVQPLVENAIKHGIANSRAGGRLSVSARSRNDQLILSVVNGGTPTNEVEIAQGRKRGVGLANLDARLRRHYGERVRLTLAPEGAETRAEVVLPIATADAGALVARTA